MSTYTATEYETQLDILTTFTGSTSDKTSHRVSHVVTALQPVVRVQSLGSEDGVAIIVKSKAHAKVIVSYLLRI